jgi:hypothetical protein
VIREWASDAARLLGKVLLAISRAFSRASEFMGDVSEWLATPKVWADIRGRRAKP